VKRHRYVKDRSSQGRCDECGQSPSEDIHRLLVWKKAPSGNFVSNTDRGTIWRCRETRDGWLPERGENPDWVTLAGPTSLAVARATCERDREA